MAELMTVEKFMTPFPHTIGADQSLKKAEKMMFEYRVRHLPVLDGGHLIGIISDRDLKFLASFKDIDPEKVTVIDAISEELFTVSPKAPVELVCAEMAHHKYGSALVIDHHKLVGIFTWVDGLHALTKVLEKKRTPFIET